MSSASTPDAADMLPRLEEGHAIVANLLDGSVPQITIGSGLIGHDHPGGVELGWAPALWKDHVVFAEDYDRMWPRATLYPLTPDGRGPGVPIAIKDRTVMPSLLPQVPYIFVPETQSKENRR